MSETGNVKPTPIQRNSADVATELTIEYLKRFGIDSDEDLIGVYAKMYATAEYLRINSRHLEGLVPEKIKALKG